LTCTEIWALLLSQPTHAACRTCEIRRTCEHPCWRFESDQDRQAAWFGHRDELLAMVDPETRPPAAWLDYEATAAERRMHQYA
jgi:hypothetical protein